MCRTKPKILRGLLGNALAQPNLQILKTYAVLPDVDLGILWDGQYKTHST
ncbi:hypothetical protein LC605_29160 [Nostoc sp. CHAB 5836]|nr:hypothetical protein [Nostoc sp. CHAB 5836]MCC5619078.1 hypothetical protein [Nostoc sp. CHAB 5836]